MNSTVCIISRVSRIDLPFYSEWLEYYDKLGVDHFYLYYVDEAYIPLDTVASYYPRTKITIKHVTARNPDHLDNFIDLNAITEDVILHIDADEFLFLKNKTIKEFLNEKGQYNAFRFPWIQCISQKLFHSSLNEILDDPSSLCYLPNIYKSAANRNLITGFRNSHEFELTETEVPINLFFDPEYFIIHFRYRGYLDLYNKFLHTNLTHDRRPGDTRLIDPEARECRLSELSMRILLYIIEVQYVKYILRKNTHIQQRLDISSTTDISLLRTYSYPRLDIFISRIDILSHKPIFDFNASDLSISRLFVKQSVDKKPNMGILFKQSHLDLT